MKNFTKEYYDDQYHGTYKLDTENYKMRLSYLNFLKNKINFKVNSVLDIGCATGFFLKACKDFGAKKITGVDVSEYAVEECKKLGYPSYKLDLAEKELPVTGKFDLISMLDLVEHLEDFRLNQIFKNIKKNMHSNTKIFIITPNDNIFRKILMKLFFQEDKTHVNLKHFKDWKLFFERMGYNIEYCSTSILNAFPPFAYCRRLFNLGFYYPFLIPFGYGLRSYYILTKNKNE